MNLQGIAEAYSQVHEKKDSSYLETDMKKRQENNEKARKDMEKVKGQKNPHFEETNIRGNDSEEQKKRLEKKRGMKLDDHPQFKKESVSGIAAAYQAIYAHHEKDENGKVIEHEVEDIEEADSLAAMDARREKRLKAQRKREGTSATGQDFGHDHGISSDERKKRQKAEFDAFVGRGKKKTNEEVEAVDEGLTGARADRARQMQDSDTKSKGGKRTPADRDTAFRLGTGTAEKGTRKVGGRGGDEYGDRGRGNAAKRRMKMEELEATGKFTAEEIEAILNADLEEGSKTKAGVGAALGNIAGKIGGTVAGAKLGGPAGAVVGRVAGGVAGGAAGGALGAKKGRKGSAALGGAVGGAGGAVGSGVGAAIGASYEMPGEMIEAAPIGAALGNIAGRTIGAKLGGRAGAEIGKYAGAAGGAALTAKKGKKGKKAVGAALGSAVPGLGVGLGSAAGAALVNSHDMEGNPIYEATKGDIEQYALDEIMDALGKLASSGAKAVKDIGALGGETGSKIAQGAVDTVKSGVKFAKKNPLAATAIGAGTAGAGALAVDQMNKRK